MKAAQQIQRGCKPRGEAQRGPEGKRLIVRLGVSQFHVGDGEYLAQDAQQLEAIPRIEQDVNQGRGP